MASKSRWADTEEDAELVAKQKREKEEKKRLKAEKARKAAEEDQKRIAAAQAQQAQAEQQSQRSPNEPPTKRRRLTPDQDGGDKTEQKGGKDSEGGGSTGESSAKLLRFEAPTWKPTASVENYDKLNDIEEGTYGWVARAKELRSGKVVALKRLKLDESTGGGARAGLPETGLREIQILKDCSHRNIVGLHEVVINEAAATSQNANRKEPIESVFLVLEFVEHDLKSILEDMAEPFLASEVKTLLRQLGEGVAYLHAHWILHRDLKTSNLLLNNRGQLKIADFGMARYVGDPAPPKLTQLVVTLWYRSPELLLGASTYDASVDMWSVGCIFGELLAREPLLQGRNEVDALSKIFELCGVPTEETWPGFRRLPNARSLRLPSSSTAPAALTGSMIRAKFPLLTAAGCQLLNSLLSLDPRNRPSAADMLRHEYFRQDPKPKHEAIKAGQERRRRKETPNAPGRGQKAPASVDFSGIFAGREREERGGGFSLRMI
ncbi:hypothetical protein PG997_015262 [Apiospora hydei]|uniref:cyclin-dependent kinase n=1 Tax=Apiospora hydei TaxID=1337664 RepID=A0ABR1USK3_9PEZI